MAYAPGAAATRTPSRTVASGRSRATSNGRSAPAHPQVTSRRRGMTTFAAGLGLGIAIGAALGILFAPKSGAETRQAIRRRGKKIRNGASDAWEDLRLELAATKRALSRKRRDRDVERAAEE